MRAVDYSDIRNRRISDRHGTHGFLKVSICALSSGTWISFACARAAMVSAAPGGEEA